jgi:hypothetical protein
MQNGLPLSFTSKQLSKRHLGKSIYEKEMLVILHAVDLWCPYILGSASKLIHIIKGSSIFWNNVVPPRRNKSG